MSSVGQAIGGLIGAVAGFFMGGPAGALNGFSLGASIGGMLDPPKGPNQTGPRLTDLSAQTSTYGTAIPRIYGTIATLGNIFWLQGDKLTEVVTVSKQKSGGKGGSKATNTTYSYNATFAVGLCHGPIDGVRRIWVGANLIYDAGSDDLETIIASNAAAASFRVYLGTEDQLPDPRIQADKGVADTPAYRGLAYIVFYDFQLKDYGNSLMGAQVKVELIKQSGTSAFASAGAAMIAPYGGGVPGIKWGSDASQFDIIRSQATPANSSKVTNYVLNVEKTFRTIESDGSSGPSRYIYAANGFDNAPYFFESAGKIYVDNQQQLLGIAIHETGVSNRSIQKRNESYFLQTRNSSNTLDVLLAYEPGYLSEPDYRLEMASGFYASTVGDFCWDVKVVPASSTSGVVYANTYNDTLTLTKTLAIAYSGISGGLVLSSMTQYAPMYAFDGKAYYLGGSPIRLVEIDITAETIAYFDLPAFGPAEYPRALKVYGDGTFIQVMTTGNPLAGSVSVLSFNKGIEGETELLSSIISSECSLSGLLTPADIDVTALSAEVRGYRISETGAIRAALEPLQGAFPFDVIQKGYKIAFVPRGGTSVKTISDDLLDARAAGSAPGVALTTSREMDSQLPRRVSIKYFDNAREYDISEQYSERLNTDAVNVLDMTLPIVLTATEAAGVAEKLLYLYWLERYNLNFTLPPECADFEPGDVFTLTGDDYTYEIRLTEINYTSGGWLECRGRFNNAAIYTPNAIGEDDHIDPKPIVFGGPCYYILLDIPCLQDVFNAPGFPAAMCGYSTSWPGGVIFRSNDDGQTWMDVQGFIGSVPIGIALAVLASGRTDIVDTKNTLSISLLSGELFSVTQSQLLNGANYFAIGAHGRWEIVAAQNCTLQVDGSYILSDFLRGRFGTEWAMTTHAIGDAVVLITDADMAWIGMESASIGLSREYRGITSGAAIDSDVSQDFTYSGVNLECLSPVYLNGSRHPATNDWTLTWIRRTRIDGTLRDSVDAALGETTESYEIDIYADGTYAVVKRTITATSQTCAYTSAQQVADFGSNQSTLYVKVYQLSATVGRGYPLTTSITR